MNRNRTRTKLLETWELDTYLDAVVTAWPKGERGGLYPLRYDPKPVENQLFAYLDMIQE